MVRKDLEKRGGDKWRKKPQSELRGGTWKDVHGNSTAEEGGGELGKSPAVRKSIIESERDVRPREGGISEDGSRDGFNLPRGFK